MFNSYEVTLRRKGETSFGGPIAIVDLEEVVRLCEAERNASDRADIKGFLDDSFKLLNSNRSWVEFTFSGQTKRKDREQYGCHVFAAVGERTYALLYPTETKGWVDRNTPWVSLQIDFDEKSVIARVDLTKDQLDHNIQVALQRGLNELNLPCQNLEPS